MTSPQPEEGGIRGRTERTFQGELEMLQLLTAAHVPSDESNLESCQMRIAILILGNKRLK